MIDHLLFNKTKFFPLEKSVIGSYVITGGNGIGGALGSIEIHFKITPDGKLTVTYAKGGEGTIDVSDLDVRHYPDVY